MQYAMLSWPRERGWETELSSNHVLNARVTRLVSPANEACSTLNNVIIIDHSIYMNKRQ